jgi:hypothetical protein
MAAQMKIRTMKKIRASSWRTTTNLKIIVKREKMILQLSNNI